MLANVCNGRTVCSCKAMASTHQTNSSTNEIASLDSVDQGCSQTRTPLTTIPGKATSSE